jgi:hypothetical protein
MLLTLLPDDYIFGQITQNRPLKVLVSFLEAECIKVAVNVLFNGIFA